MSSKRARRSRHLTYKNIVPGGLGTSTPPPPPQNRPPPQLQPSPTPQTTSPTITMASVDQFDSAL
ncbi:hypothetical protein O988_08804, partial [Pseudogymnoascus sp. VKM F-3808]